MQTSFCGRVVPCVGKIKATLFSGCSTNTAAKLLKYFLRKSRANGMARVTSDPKYTSCALKLASSSTRSICLSCRKSQKHIFGFSFLTMLRHSLWVSCGLSGATMAARNSVASTTIVWSAWHRL